MASVPPESPLPDGPATRPFPGAHGTPSSARWARRPPWRVVAGAALGATLLHVVVLAGLPAGVGGRDDGTSLASATAAADAAPVRVRAMAPEVPAQPPAAAPALPPEPGPAAAAAVAAADRPRAPSDPAAPSPAASSPTPGDTELARADPVPDADAAHEPGAATAPGEAASTPDLRLASATGAAPHDPSHGRSATPATPAATAPASAPHDGASPEAAAAGARPAATSDVRAVFEGETIPVYPTRPPPSQRLRYQLKRGMLGGVAVLDWQVESPARPGARYDAQLEATAMGLTVMTQRSEGQLDAAGLAPLRFTDRRLRGSTRATNFQRERGVIGFSGPSVEFPLLPGAQDRLSWMLQLPAIVEADPRLAQAGARVVLYVIGARGDAAVWVFRSLGREDTTTPGQVVPAIKFVREPRRPHDTQAEVWLDPARHHLPARARLGNPPGDDELELVRLPE